MTRIFFKELRIEQISNSSGVFHGENVPYNWQHHAKINDGFGSIEGDQNQIYWNTNILYDADWIDFREKFRSSKENKRDVNP